MKILITTENYTNAMNIFPASSPVLQDLFDPEQPNSPALWAVLKGSYTGKAVVDQTQSPTQCVVRTDAALSYISRQTSQVFLDEAVTHFRQIGPVWLVWPHNTYLHAPEIKDAQAVPRLEFYEYDPDSVILKQLRSQLSETYTIQNITRSLLERCEWRSEMEFYAGSLSSFIEHGLGLCLMKGDEILVEAYASALGKTRAEIGALTRAAYRGHGLASIACAYLIEACEQRGYRAYWSCDVDNVPSIQVAQKLGFQHERVYWIYEYEPTIK